MTSLLSTSIEAKAKSQGCQKAKHTQSLLHTTNLLQEHSKPTLWIVHTQPTKFEMFNQPLTSKRAKTTFYETSITSLWIVRTFTKVKTIVTTSTKGTALNRFTPLIPILIIIILEVRTLDRSRWPTISKWLNCSRPMFRMMIWSGPDSLRKL